MVDDVGDGFEQFIRERRERVDRTQRYLVIALAVTCIMLAVSNVALALRLWAGRAPAPTQLTARLPTEPATPPASTPEQAPPRTSRSDAPRATMPSDPADAPRAMTSRNATQAPAPKTTETPPAATGGTTGDAPPSVTLPTTTDSAIAPDASPSRAAIPQRAEAPPVAAEAVPPPSDLPQRPHVAAPARRIPTPRVTATPPRATQTPPPPPSAAAVPAPTMPSMPEEATATWMLSTYGREAAEARARAALRFYDARSPEGRYWRGVLAMITASR